MPMMVGYICLYQPSYILIFVEYFRERYFDFVWPTNSVCLSFDSTHLDELDYLTTVK